MIRGATTPAPKVTSVILSAILGGKAPDFFLQPGDVIWLPKAPWQKLSEYAEAAVESAVSTIAIQEAADAFQDETVTVTRSSLNQTGNTIQTTEGTVTLDISSGSESTSEGITI